MPHNKGRNQKKERTNKHNKHPSVPRAQQQSVLQQMKRTLPTFHGKIASTDAVHGGYQKVYKEATLRFHNWMAHEACPDAKMKVVGDYCKGVDHMLDHNRKAYMNRTTTTQIEDFIVAPPEIMTSLASSIRLRERFTADLLETKDGGHLGNQYILDVLKYCQRSLRFANRIAALAIDVDVQKQGTTGDRLRASTLDVDAEEDIDWGEIDRDIKDGNVPTYEGVEVKEAIPIKESLLKGDDRFQAMALLGLMDDLMGMIHNQYVLLKDHMRGVTGSRQSSSCLQLLMECAMVANAATEYVNQAANEMAIDHPHLSSFYHVLALVKFPQYIAEINDKMKKNKLEPNSRMALQFVAKVVESVFRNGESEDLLPIIHRFAAQSGLMTQDVVEIARKIHSVAGSESSFELVQRLDLDQTAERDVAGLKPHTWLCPFEYIGGNRCILNTHKMVQQAMEFDTDDNRRLVNQPGYWGKAVDESSSPARRILGDLDEPFVTAIIPELVEICKVLPFDCLPHWSELVTVIDLIQRHVKGDRTKPVPVALTFGLHAVLISIFVLQGDGDLARIAAKAKESYNTLFKQLEAVSDRSKAPDNSHYFYINAGMYRSLAEYVKPTNTVKSDHCHGEENQIEAELLAFWNPLIGGEYMLYATYMGSIGLGSATVNSVGQLRFALHLYNALKLHDPTFDVPFLQEMDKAFKDTKAIWVDGKPHKGSCCKAFWMTLGHTASQAARITESLPADKHFHDEGDVLVDSFRLDGGEDIWYQMNELKIRPEEFSQSYRRLVQQDFASSKANANERTAEAQKHRSFLDDFVSRINITLDAMDEDRNNIVPVNFTATGSILLEFVDALSVHMGWTRSIQYYVRNTPELIYMRQNATMGTVAFDVNVRRNALVDYWGHILFSVDRGTTEQLSSGFCLGNIAAFTKSFFDKVEKNRYVFFDGEEEITTVIQRTPLNASLPFSVGWITLGVFFYILLHAVMSSWH